MVSESKTTSAGKDRELAKELEDTFPASDPPSITQPGGGITDAKISTPSKDRLERIRERAYAMWIADGKSHGRDEQHWKEAEREIDIEDSAQR